MPSLQALFAVLIAPCVGSFLAVLAARWPGWRSALAGRSRCPACARTLTAAELLPIASHLRQRGRCRCPQKIALPRADLALELAALAVAVMAAAVVEGWLLWASLALGWWLLLLAAIDARTLTLPDGLVLPLIPAGLAVVYLLQPGALLAHGIAAAAGFAAFAAIALAYRRLRRRDGLGLGDAKLLAAAGAWLGWQALPGVVLVAALGALAVVLAGRLIGARVEWHGELAFGPYLALAFWLAWLWGPVTLA